MKHHRAWLLIFILILTGCQSASIHGEAFIKVNKDGSGQYRLTLLTHPSVMHLFQEYKPILLHHQFEIEEILNGKQAGWVATKKFSNILEEKFPLAVFSSTKNQPLKQAIDIQSGFYYKQIQVDYPVDLTFITEEFPITRYLSNRIHLYLTVSLPVPFQEQNANSISSDQKTATWKLEVGKINRIQAKVKIPNPMGWILTSIGILLLLILGIVGFKLRNKKSTVH